MRYVFGDFVLDVESGELLRSGEAVVLRRQTFRLLQLLIEHAPALMSRDTLLDTVWGRTALSPNAVPQAISELRRALGDDAQSPRFIQTRHRRGYRFVAEVTCQADPDSDASDVRVAEPAEQAVPGHHMRPKRAHWFAAAIAMVCLVLVAAWAAPQLFGSQHAPEKIAPNHSSRLAIAALPAGDKVPSWVPQTALELLGQNLSASRLHLVRSDALGLTDTSHDTRWQHQAHDLLGADYAVGGRWRGNDQDALILDLNVVDLADGSVVASRKIDGKRESLDEIVAQASALIAASLQLAPLDDAESKPPLKGGDGATFGAALTALNKGRAKAAAKSLAELYDRLGQPMWVEPALIKAQVQSGNRDAALALLDSRLGKKDALPLGERLRLQAEAATLRYQPENAAAALRALLDLYPDDIDNSIRLVQSEIDALQGVSARKSLARLAALPAARNDPRLTLLRAKLARLDNKFDMAEHEAATALGTAQRYDLPALVVSAAMAQTDALRAQGKLDEGARLLADIDKTWSTRVDPRSVLDMRVRRLGLLREQGHLSEAQKLLDQLTVSFSEPLPRARIGIEGALLSTAAHHPEDANAVLQQVKPVVDHQGDPDLSIAWLDAEASTAIARNDPETAQRSFAKAFALARSHGRASHYVALQVNAGMALVHQKRYAEADQQWQQALSVFEALGDKRGQATCLGNLAASASAQGKLERSVELNTRALSLFRELKLSGPQARTAYNLALAAARDGRLQRARNYFKEAGAAWQHDGQHDLVLRAAVGEANIALVSGNADAAKHIMASLTHVEEASLLSRSHVLAMTAQIALALGDLKASRRLNEQALSLRKQDGHKGWIALSELELLRNDLLADSDATRVQVQSEALAAGFAAMGETRDEARAWLLVADAQLSRKKIMDARRSLDKVKQAARTFSDRTLDFDLEWAEAWASDRNERLLRLQALQQHAKDQGYLAQAMRVQQALATDSDAQKGTAAMTIPVPPYARTGITRDL